MTRRERHDLKDRLSDLEQEYAIGEEGTGVTMLVPPESLAGHRKLPDTENDVDAVTVVHDHDHDHGSKTWDEIVLPEYRPEALRRGGVHLLSYLDVVAVWESMPEDVLEKELEYRLEHGEPIPPILQQ